MSKANGAIEKKDTFLQHVSLKNYKSIKDVEIDFKPGLNIIIGKNASGKTNFVNGLDAILNFRFDDLLDSEFIIKALSRNDEIEVNKRQSTQNTPVKDLFDLLINHNTSLKIKNKDVDLPEHQDVKEYLQYNKISFNSLKIDYGIQYTKTSQFINTPFSFVILNNGKVSRDLLKVTMGDNWTQFVYSFFYRLYLEILLSLIQVKNESDVEILKKEIVSLSEECFENINRIIDKYTPIQRIRLNRTFNIIKENTSEKQTITNFYLEFLIDENWLPFSLLSDGTKRLFYIISEMLSIYDSTKAILLEEPELGIHPHQLHQLMQFIKEQSREKQIILTTHSPQVLDVLGPDELDRVIICHSDPKNGTQLSHLTEKEIAKAKKYMKEEAFLSDYWRFSDLEPT